MVKRHRKNYRPTRAGCEVHRFSSSMVCHLFQKLNSTLKSYVKRIKEKCCTQRLECSFAEIYPLAGCRSVDSKAISHIRFWFSYSYYEPKRYSREQPSKSYLSQCYIIYVHRRSPAVYCYDQSNAPCSAYHPRAFYEFRVAFGSVSRSPSSRLVSFPGYLDGLTSGTYPDGI